MVYKVSSCYGFLFYCSSARTRANPFQCKLGKMADFGERTVSQDWRHKKEKSSDGKLSEDVALE